MSVFLDTFFDRLMYVVEFCKSESSVKSTGKKVFSVKKYDARCPLCGTMNHSLYLDETDGWMECEHCHETVQVQEYVKLTKIPVYNMGRIAVSRITASA